MSLADLTLRRAGEADVPRLLELIRALAEYERLGIEAAANAEDLHRALFVAPIRAEALLAELDHAAIGFALWFHNFSTFTGKPGLYLEDIFVQRRYRGMGVGRAMFRALAQTAVAEGCARFEWTVLDANLPARGFYQGLGARPMSEWTVQRLSGPALARLAT